MKNSQQTSEENNATKDMSKILDDFFNESIAELRNIKKEMDQQIEKINIEKQIHG